MLAELLAPEQQTEPSRSQHDPAHILPTPSSHNHLPSIPLASYLKAHAISPTTSPSQTEPLSPSIHSTANAIPSPPPSPLPWHRRPFLRRLLLRFLLLLLLIFLSTSGLFSLRAARLRYSEWLLSLQPYPQLPVLVLLCVCSAWMAFLPGSLGILCMITTAFPWHLSLPLCCLCSILATAINLAANRALITPTRTTLARYIPILHLPPASPGLTRCLTLLPFTTTLLLRLPYLGLATVSTRLSRTPLPAVVYLLASAMGVLPGCVVWAVVSGQVVGLLEWMSGLEVGERVCMVLGLGMGLTAVVSALLGVVKWRLRVAVKAEVVRLLRARAAKWKGKGRKASKCDGKRRLRTRQRGDEAV